MDKTDNSAFFGQIFTEVDALRKFSESSRPSIPAEFLDLVKDSCLLEDWQWFKNQILDENLSEKDAFWLLSISRNIGLIEFEKLRILRKMKIRVLGASVAGMTIDLLASLGCEDITCIDPGVLEISNLPRLPHSTVEDLGLPKAEVLVRQLKKRNPLGKFTGIHGKVIALENERSSAKDQVLEKFVADANLVIEVIDDVRMKILTQQLFIEQKKNVPFLFIADLGNEPMVKFITEWSDEQRSQYQKFLQSFQEKNAGFKTLAASSIYAMVKEDLPTEHAAQFALSCFGEVPYWAQTPIASRLSAGIALKKILESIPITGKTLQSLHSNPNIHNICQKLFTAN